MTALNLWKQPRDHQHQQCPECGRIFTLPRQKGGDMHWCSHDGAYTKTHNGFTKTQMILIGPSSDVYAQYRVEERSVYFTEGYLTHVDIREIGRQIGGLEKRAYGRSMLDNMYGEKITDPLRIAQMRVQSAIVKEFDMSGIVTDENGGFAFAGDPRPGAPWYRMEGVVPYNRQGTNKKVRT